MIQVNSSQFNYQYGDQMHFPYSIASLVAYIKHKTNLGNNFKFEKTFVSRHKVDEYISQCKNTEILLCSCYVWNWELQTYLAEEVKKINPNCLIIFGGPHVPNDIRGFFEKYPYVDILVHGEGELILTNIFSSYLKDKNFFDVKGISTKDFTNPPQFRVDNLDELPSPYLTDVVWDLVDKNSGIRWIASWETNRGCPYECTFCDWGDSRFTNIRKFSIERLMKEIEWFENNGTVYINCCDANFGIFVERDLQIATKLKEMALRRKESGNEMRLFAVSWAKNTTEKIMPIAQQLKDGGILGAVTLAVQSLDPETLNIIKRANIKFDNFSNLTEDFRKNRIPTYTELILGLPGETVETFKTGLETLIHTKIDSVFVFRCTILPNAPMNVPSYREQYKIKTTRSPLMLRHSSIHDRGIQEYEYVVTETISHTVDELKEMNLYTWAFLTLQNLGLLEHISEFYNKFHKMHYMKFYETFLEFCRTSNSLFAQEYEKIIKFIDTGFSGNGWNHTDKNLGEIIWEIEEGSWLRLAYDKSELLLDIDKFLSFIEEKHGFGTNQDMLNDLARFQTFVLSPRNDFNKIRSENFHFNWKEFLLNGGELKSQRIHYWCKNLVFEKDPIKWNYETIFYGRRNRLHKCPLEKLKTGNDGKEYSTIDIFDEKPIPQIS
tara:strand:+ start:6237 stop:8225 length:1989 start_codon:yes stop_codon:yes gene_type:complete